MPPKRRGNPKAASLSTLSSRKPSTTPTIHNDNNDNDPAEGSSAPGIYQEPPVRVQPSYLEYEGIPRYEVTNDMQPLGTPPTNAVKLRVKAPKPPELFRNIIRSKKTGTSKAKEQKEQVGSAESSQPLVTPTSTDSFHPMITRKRTQSHNAQGDSQASTRPVSQASLQEPVSRPRRSVSQKPKDPITTTQPRRSASRKPQDTTIPQARRSASRPPQASLPPTRRSASRKAQESVPSTRSVSRNRHDSVPPTRRSVSRKPQDPILSARRSQSRQVEGRSRITHRSQSRPLENPHPLTRHPLSPTLEEQSPQNILKRKHDGQENMSKGIGETSSVKTAPAPSSSYSGPSSRTSAAQLRLKQVVDAAVQRSNASGDSVTGTAIKKLYEGSLHDRTLADLLDGVLSQEPTAQQTTDFQAFIKVARKQIKADSGSARRSARSTRPSSSRLTGASKLSTNVAENSNLLSTTENPSSIPQAISTATEHASTLEEENPPKRRKISKSVSTSSAEISNLPPKTEIPSSLSQVISTATEPHAPSLEENPSSLPQAISTATEHPSSLAENPPKRRKISRSVSTLSSLSSIPSNDPELSPIEKGDRINLDQPFIEPTAVGEPGLAPRPHRVPNIPQPRDVSSKPPVEDLRDQKEPSLDNEVDEVKKRLTKDFSHVVPMESNIRNEASASGQHKPLPVKSKPLLTLTQPRPPTAASRKRKHDDDEASVHSAASSHGELLIPPPPGARATSRGTTPNPSERPAKRTKTARVKMSPEKKKRTVVTGTGRTSGRRAAKASYAEEVEVDHNEDVCTACGGGGKLLCCDHCPSAFHFNCVDPPLDEDNPPEGEWLCNSCQSKTDNPAKKSHGLFSSLMENIEKHNPSVFSLPRELREGYEGVRTGDKGEYQEYTEVGTKARQKTYDEARADSLRLKDKAGKTILCFKCRESALGGRPMAQCDYCPLRWHLDCLDPPRAALPYKQPSGNPRHTWMCPVHVEHELRTIDPSIRAAGESNPAGKVYRLRKPKNARVVGPAMSRGLPNDGLIDIIEEASDDEVERPVISRISERAIKLDFISMMKRTNEAEAAREARERAAADEAFGQASFIDRQAALNLCSFARGHQDLGLSSQRVGELTHALIAEAPANVVSLFTREEEERSADVPVRLAPSSSTAEKSIGGTERQQLLLLQELIRRRLEAV